LCTIEEGEASAAKPEKIEDKSSAPEEKAAEKQAVASNSYASGTPSPAATKIIAERGIDASTIQGTGKDGRITKDDALKAKEVEKVAPVSTPAPATKAEPTLVSGSRNERRERMSSLRRTIAKRLVTVKNDTAMLTTFNEVDMKPIMDLRSKYKDLFKEKHGVGLGFMSFFTKAVCQALKEWPAVNARLEENEIVYSDFVDISIAVSAPKGLVVPVVKNAESLSLQQIEKEIIDLATKARDSKLTIEEMTGGTFTITNGGVFGSMMSTPIINAPQSAILGMHNIIQRPVAVNGEVVIRPMMYLALSYDHRIVDGRESVSFLVRVKQLLEDPARLLLDV
jgi:2-oxoglutarate dehydrogenase E2 component (dihydrolipoamide succinyltransferase)